MNGQRGEPELPLPLEGVRVIDFSWIVAGPQATRILADLGAEVIKVESESHIDSMRVGADVDPSQPSFNRSGFHNNLNRNKLGITANLAHPKGLEAVERLLAISDVVIENFSSGAFERMGFGWERLRAINPRLVYISMSGFGHSGRDSAYVTWGPTAQAISGVTAMSGLPSHEPAGWGFSYLDHTAGYYGAIAALLALEERESTGRGRYIDIAQIETGLLLAGVPILDYQVNARPYERTGNRSRYPAVAPHGIYRCADDLDGNDRWLALAVERDEQWPALCEVLGLQELVADPRFASNLARVEHEDVLDALITSRSRCFEARELMYLLQARGVPAGVAQTTRDKMEYDPQLRERDFYPIADHPEQGAHRFEGYPARFSAARWRNERGAPCVGQHTFEVLKRLLGLSDEELLALSEEAAL
jgi:benzylsuccinate CoA-transferase BbsF subunit